MLASSYSFGVIFLVASIKRVQGIEHSLRRFYVCFCWLIWFHPVCSPSVVLLCDGFSRFIHNLCKPVCLTVTTWQWLKILSIMFSHQRHLFLYASQTCVSAMRQQFNTKTSPPDNTGQYEPRQAGCKVAWVLWKCLLCQSSEYNVNDVFTPAPSISLRRHRDSIRVPWFVSERVLMSWNYASHPSLSH